MKKLGLLLFLMTGLGCATQKYGFRPAGDVMTAEAGYPASHYAVPPASPHGEVFVTSFGTREIDVGGGQHAQLIHVRLAVADHDGATAWTVDPGKQLLVAPGGSPQRPDFMEVDGRRDTDTRVARGRRKVFDLYYRMPGGARDASHVGGFELQWQLDGVGGQTFVERTSFAREPYRHGNEAPATEIAVGVAPPWWAYGYGPGWWGGFGVGTYGPWGYPYYGYGPYVGIGIGYGYGYYGYGHYGYGGYHPVHGGGYGYGHGGGAVRGPVMRGRRP
jgi:hypothetical protein